MTTQQASGTTDELTTWMQAATDAAAMRPGDWMGLFAVLASFAMIAAVVF